MAQHLRRVIRASVIVLALLGSHPLSSESNEPKQAAAKTDVPAISAAPGRLIVKFKPSLTECAHCLLAHKRSFSSALTDGAPGLDQLNSHAKVKSAESLFVHQCSHSSRAVQAALHAQQQRLQHTFAKRQRRVSHDTALPDLTNIYLLEVDPTANPEVLAQEYAADPHVEYAQPNYPVTIQ